MNYSFKSFAYYVSQFIIHSNSLRKNYSISVYIGKIKQLGFSLGKQKARLPFPILPHSKIHRQSCTQFQLSKDFMCNYHFNFSICVYVVFN